MREQEKRFYEKKRKEKEAKAEAMKEEELAAYKEKIAPAMAEVEMLLKKGGHGAEVSHEALEMVARWKLGLPEQE